MGKKAEKRWSGIKDFAREKDLITIESPKEVGRREVLDQISCGNQEDAGRIKDAQNAQKAVLLECLSNLTANENV